MKCRFCGEPAGFMRRQHQECYDSFMYGKNYIRKCIDQIYQSRDCMNISEVIAHTAKKRMIPDKVLKPLLEECWVEKAAEALSDDVISEDEISILIQMIPAMGLDYTKVWSSGPGEKIKKYGHTAIVNEVLSASARPDGFHDIEQKVHNISNLYGFTGEEEKNSVIDAWRKIIDKSLEDGVISKTEEDAIDILTGKFGITQNDDNTYMTKIVKSLILRDVLDGTISKRANITIDFPVIMQRGEEAIWLFNNVNYYEYRNRRQYVGGSAGMSFRVAKGVYFRTSEFKGYPVDTTEAVCVGCGILLITNKHLFWISSLKVVKIPVKKLIFVNPCSDGIIVQKDGVTAKPQYFRLDDPWFACNLISNLHLLS